MWIVAIAWMYIAVMMALAEGTSPTGTWLGATITFVMYGVAPMALVLYLMGAPARRKIRIARERAEREAHVRQLAGEQGTPGATDEAPSAAPPLAPTAKAAQDGTSAPPASR